MEYEYLVHHGVLGQKWGVRRYQNKDGSRIQKKIDKSDEKLKQMNRITDFPSYEKETNKNQKLKAKMVEKRGLDKVSNSDIQRYNEYQRNKTQSSKLERKEGAKTLATGSAMMAVNAALPFLTGYISPKGIVISAAFMTSGMVKTAANAGSAAMSSKKYQKSLEEIKKRKISELK